MLILSSCSDPAQPPPAAPARSGCVDTGGARAVWQDVNERLNRVVMITGHPGLEEAVTGPAVSILRRYIDTELVAKNLREREQDRLDSLNVVRGGCNGGPLVVDVRETLVRDDYLKPDGGVDHADPLVGRQSHLRKTFVRSGPGWKLSDLQDLEAPAPTRPPQTA
ncbi:MAG: hypothetical protein ABR564_05875 [Candidatus Dormibacteria bacterium]